MDILKVVRFYTKDMDWEKFYEECIPKSCLPSDYGGDLESIEVLQSKSRAELEGKRDFFLFEEHLMNFEYDGIDLGVK